MMSAVQPIGQSRLFIMDKRKTLREAKIEIFKLFRPLIPGISVQVGKNAEDKAIEEEYKHYFESGKDYGLYQL